MATLEASTEQVQPDLRVADTEDVLPIHRFLCVVAQPILLAEIEPEKSIREIFRLTATRRVLIAEVDGVMVGTIGLHLAEWWYADDSFLTDRWFFVLPQYRTRGVGAALKAAAHGLAKDADMLFLLNPKYRPPRDG